MIAVYVNYFSLVYLYNKNMVVNKAECVEQYRYAYKLARKSFKDNKRKHKDVYLKALEEEINIYDYSIDRIGQIEVPTNLIVGTVNTSRKYSFASNFMPLIKTKNEFYNKWINVCAYHLSDNGISDQPTAFEYLGKFYIEEGNKRVSVLKSFGAVFIPCDVKRLLPKKIDSFESKLYYEFLDFYKMSKLYSIQFNKIGYYKKFQRLLMFDEEHEWTRKERIEMIGLFERTCNFFNKININTPYADCFLVLIEIYGYKRLLEMNDKELYRSILEVKQKIIYDKAHYNILCLSDEEDNVLWNSNKDYFKDYDFIISCGDLKKDYLEYLVTISNKPLFYVHGNHDDSYDTDEPSGCINVDDELYVFNGIRILGLGGSYKYKDNAKYMYSEKEMNRRILKLKRKIRKYGGVDIIVAHAPIKGYGDLEDYAHQGFECFKKLIKDYHPKYFFFGHIHTNYDYKYIGYYKYEGCQIINVSNKTDIIY